MRIGINVPWRDQDGAVLDVRGVAAQAALIEEAGLDGIWVADHLNASRPDPLMYLVAAAQATTRVELGTCIYIVPLRKKYDLGQRFVTMQSLAPGRCTFGVGTGSYASEYEMAGIPFEDRFRLLQEDMVTIRAVCNGTAEEFNVGSQATTPMWGAEVGPPRFVLGSWHSEPQLRRAAEDYNGWMASAGGGTVRIGGWKVMEEAIRQFRDFGGTRALMATVMVNLRAESVAPPPGENAPFTLRCNPGEAASRLHHLEDLGYDDVLLTGGFAHTYTLEELQEIRSLIPADPRPYQEA